MAEQVYPEPTTGALIFSPDGKLFLMKSPKWKDKYVIPGGHVELGEKLSDCLKREIKEETNLDIYDIDFICFQEFIFDDAFWKKKHFVLFTFACKTKSTDDIKLNEEGIGHVWVMPTEALCLPIDPYTRRSIQEYLRMKK